MGAPPDPSRIRSRLPGLWATPPWFPVRRSCRFPNRSTRCPIAESTVIPTGITFCGVDRIPEAGPGMADLGEADCLCTPIPVSARSEPRLRGRRSFRDARLRGHPFRVSCPSGSGWSIEGSCSGVTTTARPSRNSTAGITSPPLRRGSKRFTRTPIPRTWCTPTGPLPKTEAKPGRRAILQTHSGLESGTGRFASFR